MLAKTLLLSSALAFLAWFAPAQGGASVAYTVTGNWGSGFQASVTLTNGPTALNNWNLSFDFPHAITSLWDGVIVAQTGIRYSVDHPAWSTTLAAGAQATFGFVATGAPTLVDPTNAVLNGVPVPVNGVPSGASGGGSTGGGSTGGSCSQAGALSPPISTPLDTQKRIIGYFTSWSVYGRNFHVPQIPAEKITHINYAFANISAAGTIALGDNYADVDRFYPGDSWAPGALRGSFHQLQILKARYPHLKTMISVGGWTWSSRFSDVALTPSSRALFAQSCVSFITTYGFDGVDIDWEYPVSGGLASNTTRPADRQNYTLLLAELRQQLDLQAALDGRPYLLSIAAPAGPAVYANIEMNLVHQSCDWINLMSYDFHGGWETTTGFNAPLYAQPADPNPDPVAATQFNVASGAQAYLAGGVPAAKLVVGMPFYGRGWSGVSNTNNGLYQPSTGLPQGSWEPGVFDYKDLALNYVPNFTRSFDPIALVPWLYDAQSGVMISYDDPQSIGLKAQYVDQNQLGGAMFWEFSGDTAQNALLDAIFAVLAEKKVWMQVGTSGGGAGDLYFRVGGAPLGTDNVIVVGSQTPAPAGLGSGALVGLVPDGLFWSLASTPLAPYSFTHYPVAFDPYAAAPVQWPGCTASGLAGQVFELRSVAYSYALGITSLSDIIRVAW